MFVDVVALLAVLAIAGLGSRWMTKDMESDRHSQFCLGLCTHVEETEAPNDPNNPDTTEEAMTVVVGGPAIVDHSPTPAPERVTTGEVK